MLFKTLTRHAVLAKNFGASSAATNTTPFFVSTNHLARYQSQVAVKPNGASFNNKQNSHSASNNGSTACAGGGVATSGVNFSPFSPLASLDDDRQQTVAESGANRFKRNSQLLSKSNLLKNQQQVEHQLSKEKSSSEDAEKKTDTIEQKKRAVKDAQYSEVSLLQGKGEHLQVIEYFEALRGKEIVPSLAVYNVVLASVANLCETDVSPLLQVYSDMIDNKIVPDVAAYSAVIECLLEKALGRLEQYNDKVLFQGVKLRHNINALNSTLSYLDLFDEGRGFAVLAIDLYNASCSVRTQEYPSLVYEQLDTICAGYGLENPVYSSDYVCTSIKQSFEKGDVLDGISLYQQVMELNPQALETVIEGFIKLEDYESAWNWIVSAENDGEFALSMNFLESTLSSMCSTGQLAFCADIFELISNKENGSDRASADYAMLCIESDNAEGLYNAIRDSQVRGGVWDQSTIVEVVKYLINTANDIDLAMLLLTAQSERLCQYMEQKGIYNEFEDLNCEAFEDIFFELKNHEKLSVDVLLSLAKCRFKNASVQNEIMQNLWSFKGLSRLVTIEIISLHNEWLQQNPPQGITALEARENFKRLLDEVSGRGPLDEEFVNQVNKSLEILGLDLGSEWWNTQDDPNAAVEKLLRGENIEPNYLYALQNLPHPSASQESFEQWVQIHRAVVSNGPKHIAVAAYQNLIDMGSHPDATGYGKLISADDHAIDSATDALILFNEAVGKVRPNGFLYNVLLAKLSKARRLKEAMMHFQDMDRAGVVKTSITYGTMISAACRAGDEALALQLFDEMESKFVPSIAPFNILLQHYVHTKQRDEALKIYDRLCALCEPSPHTYKLLIDLYTTMDPIDIKAAEKVLALIPYPTTQHYSALIYAKGVGMKDLEAANAVYQGPRDELIYQALLESYVMNNQDPTPLLESMEKDQVRLNAYMANILIRGWAVDSLDKSVGLFYHTVQSKTAEPSTFESMVRAYLHHNEMTAALNVIMLMKTNYSYPEPVVAKVENLIKTLNGDLVESIFRQM